MNPASEPDPAPSSEPVVLVPVAAEDVARRKRRIWLGIVAAAVAVALAGAYLYKRSTDPIKARESFDTGVRLYSIGRYPQAKLSFDRAASLDPKFADAYLWRGRANMAYGHIDAAIADFAKTLELRPKDGEALVARAECWLNVKDYQATVADASRAIGIDSRLAKAYNLRGVARREMGDPDKALEDLTRAVTLAPRPENYFERAATYQLLGEHWLALADLDNLIALAPDAAPSYFARARSREAVGDLAGAEQDRDRGRILDGR